LCSSSWHWLRLHFFHLEELLHFAHFLMESFPKCFLELHHLQENLVLSLQLLVLKFQRRLLRRSARPVLVSEVRLRCGVHVHY